MSELILSYWRYAQSYYVKDGKPSAHLEIIRATLALVRRPYGRTPAKRFGPLALQAIQQQLIRRGV